MSNDPLYSLTFDGVSGAALTELDVQPEAMPDSTWEAWVRPADVDPRQVQAILSSDDGLWERMVGISADGKQFVVGTGLGPWEAAPVSKDFWQHIAVVFQTDSIRFYLNGKESVYELSPAPQTSLRGFTMGASPVCNQQFFQGRLVEVRVWALARTAQQIQATMDWQLSGAEAGLIALWQGETVGDKGSELLDATSHGFNATLTAGVSAGPESGISLDRLPPPEDAGAPYEWLLSALRSGSRCTVRGNIIFEIRKIRAQGQVLAGNIIDEVHRIEAGKAAMERLTGNLNDCMREINQMRRQLKEERERVDASLEELQEFVQKEKVLKLSDVVDCVKSEAGDLMEYRGTHPEEPPIFRNRVAELEYRLKTIREAVNHMNASRKNPA